MVTVQEMQSFKTSPSSRRAWVEIPECPGCTADALGSPSSRRAWVEIPECPGCTADALGRPPRGGRG